MHGDCVERGALCEPLSKWDNGILVMIAQEYKSTLYSEMKIRFPDSWHFLRTVQVFVKRF